MWYNASIVVLCASRNSPARESSPRLANGGMAAADEQDGDQDAPPRMEDPTQGKENTPQVDSTIVSGDGSALLGMIIERAGWLVEYNRRTAQHELTGKLGIDRMRAPLTGSLIGAVRAHIPAVYRRMNSRDKLAAVRFSKADFSDALDGYTHDIAPDLIYDPAVEYFEGLRGRPAYQTPSGDAAAVLGAHLTTHYGVEDTALNRFASLALWLAPVTRAFAPGSRAVGEDLPFMIVLQSVKRGLGKSALLTALLPSFMRWLILENLTSKAAHRGGITDDERMRRIAGHLIVNFDEFIFREADKGFITSLSDTYRQLYRDPVTKPRDFVLVGTTNDQEVIPTAADNRRIIVVAFSKRVRDERLLSDEFIMDMNALAVKSFDGGVRLEVTDSLQADIRAIGMEYSRGSTTLDWVKDKHDDNGLHNRRMKEIEALALEDKLPAGPSVTAALRKELERGLVSLGYKRKRRRREGDSNPQRVWTHQDYEGTNGAAPKTGRIPM